jgi:acetate kinase
MSNILVLNTGSSSIKYQVIDISGPTVLATGLIERIGESTSTLTHAVDGQKLMVERTMADHGEGLRAMTEAFRETSGDPLDTLTAVGHRVVHGGDRFAQPAVINADVIDAIADCVPLAPLHNPANLMGIEMAMKTFPDVPHVAVFDTAFHQTMPEASYRYAIDRAIADTRRIRRYGFHGTSHAYVSRQAAEFLGIPLSDARVVTLHLGNGASACAVRGGASVDTSMGLTPLAGLVMGTRSGDIDPGALIHLLGTGMTVEELDVLLNRQSGLKGMCGHNDLRVIHRAIERGDPAAAAALDVYVHSVRHYLGAYLVELGGADAIVFTAGVGENDPEVRQRVCADLEALGVVVDLERNADTRGPEAPVDIATGSSPVRVLVVPTDEELEIATQTVAALA